MDDKLQYGTRNFVVRYNGTLSPTWLVNASWTWGHNNLNDTPADPNVYQIIGLYAADHLRSAAVLSVSAPPRPTKCVARSNARALVTTKTPPETTTG